MKRLSIIFALLFCFNIQQSSARILRDYKVTSTGPVSFKVDSVDFRSDLIRVYGKIVGKPHVSFRFDNMILNVQKRESSWIDIDGIDVKRWFQWENSPYMPVEIDFAPKAVKPGANFTISTYGPKGICIWKFYRRK